MKRKHEDWALKSTSKDVDNLRRLLRSAQQSGNVQVELTERSILRQYQRKFDKLREGLE